MNIQQTQEWALKAIDPVLTIILSHEKGYALGYENITKDYTPAVFEDVMIRRILPIFTNP